MVISDDGIIILEIYALVFAFFEMEKYYGIISGRFAFSQVTTMTFTFLAVT